MEIKKRLFLYAFILTLVLFIGLVLLNRFMDNHREQFIENGLQDVVNNANELQTMLLMGDVYGEKMTCLIFSEKLKKLDKSVWTLGLKIDEYRVASQDFLENPWYLEQKTVFNQQEVLYLSLLKRSKQKCGFTTPIILFFYQNSDDCKKCDDQSFVLGDINRKAGTEVSIFSFDIDRNLTTVNLLKDFYDITDLPCLVIEDKKYCGMQDNAMILSTLCQNATISLCPKQ